MHKSYLMPVRLTNGTWYINLHNYNHCSHNSYHSPPKVSVPVILRCPYRSRFSRPWIH